MPPIPSCAARTRPGQQTAEPILSTTAWLLADRELDKE